MRACHHHRMFYSSRDRVCGGTACSDCVCLLFSVVVVFEQLIENRLHVDAATVKEHLMLYIILHLVLCVLLRTNSWSFRVCQQPLNNRSDPHPLGSLPLHLLLIDRLYCGSDGSPDLTPSFNLFYLFISFLICVRKDLPVSCAR